MLASGLVVARIALAILEKFQSPKRKMKRTNLKTYLFFALLRVAANVVSELLARIEERDETESPSVTVKPAKRR